MRTTFSQLLPLVQEHRWDLAQVQELTGCGDQCGMCLPYLREMLASGTTVFHSVLEEPAGPDEAAA
jgi:bacterioferritin-associated ferredoxin